MTTSRSVVGLIPAAGQAKRLGTLPFSKELYPVDVSDEPDKQHTRPVIEFLLDDMRQTGIHQVYIVVRDGKWDIPRHLGDGSGLGLSIAYLMMGRPWGVPYSLDQAHAHVRGSLIALGFPDIIVGCPHAFARCLAKQEETGADVVVGSFPADDPQAVDMLDMAEHDKVARFIIKPQTTTLTRTWPLAVWTPAFTEYMHEFLSDQAGPAVSDNDLQLGNVFNAAIDAGFDVRATAVSDEPFVDIGSPGGLARFAHQRDRLLSKADR